MLKLLDLSTLSSLYLAETQVTDAGVHVLIRMPKLEYINLQQTKITDACMDDLASMPALRNVDLRQTHVTADAIKRLTDKCRYLRIESP
jgi:hypothetical protein